MLVISFSGKDFVSWRQSEGIYQGGTQSRQRAEVLSSLCKDLFCNIYICTGNLENFQVSISFIRFDTLWLCRLGQPGRAKPAESHV